MHVAFFQHIEETHLHQFIKIWKFVHGKDAAVHARNQAEVQCIFRAHAGAGSKPRWVDFTNQVGELGAGGQSFGVAIFAMPPGDGNAIGGVGAHLPPGAGDGVFRIFMHCASRNIQVRQPLIKEVWKHPHQAALPLTLLAKEQDVVASDDGRCQFWQDGVVIAKNAGE